jgi:hypothetical protein
MRECDVLIMSVLSSGERICVCGVQLGRVWSGMDRTVVHYTSTANQRTSALSRMKFLCMVMERTQCRTQSAFGLNA